MLDARSVALALGGEAVGRDRVLAPGPGHSRADRSLSILLDPDARDGFVVHSFAGDDPIVCRDHLRAALRLDRDQWRPAAPRHRAVASHNDTTPLALRIWERAQAHHLLPAGRHELSGILPKQLPGVILITVHPEAVAVEALRTVDTILALGSKAGEVVATYCKAIGAPVPPGLPRPDDNEGLYYTVAGDTRPLRLDRLQQEHKRHTRKYAEGRLGSDRSFYFRGPDNALNLRAHNLMIFLEMAAGIDDRTWEHHRQAGDYSRWFREAIKNEELAGEAAEVERDTRLDPKESRDRIAQAISRRYTAPAHEVD